MKRQPLDLHSLLAAYSMFSPEQDLREQLLAGQLQEHQQADQYAGQHGFPNQAAMGLDQQRQTHEDRLAEIAAGRTDRDQRFQQGEPTRQLEQVKLEQFNRQKKDEENWALQHGAPSMGVYRLNQDEQNDKLGRDALAESRKSQQTHQAVSDVANYGPMATMAAQPGHAVPLHIQALLRLLKQEGVDFGGDQPTDPNDPFKIHHDKTYKH